MTLVPRLQESVAFTYDPQPTELSIVPHVEYLGAVRAKEIVFKLELDRSDVTEGTRSWGFSASLSSRYVYAPVSDGRSIVRLPEIRLSGPAEKVRILPVRWTDSGESPAELIGDIWTIRSVDPWAQGRRPTQVARLWERR